MSDSLDFGKWEPETAAQLRDQSRQRVAELERELAEADGRAAANGARAAELAARVAEVEKAAEVIGMAQAERQVRLAELAALLKPFADAYAEALACSPSLEADHPDGGAFLFRKPRMAAWRAAHRALNPGEEPTT